MEATFFLDRRPALNSIGGFDVIADLGRSGTADLYLALAPPTEGCRSRVVIKVLPESDDDEEDRAMFLDEARLARGLSHPNLIQTIDVGKEGHSYYIVAECLDGQLLSRIRKRGTQTQRIPLSVELRVASDVLAGLHYLHELKDDEGKPLDVVHRDITPQRVFITYDGEVKIADFAIAKASVRQAETQVGLVRGDLLYFAPEILRRAPVDRRADIFAVGMMLWEAAAGRRFWSGFTTAEIRQRLLSGEFPRETAPPEVPVEVLDIIRQAMDPDPSRRFGTAQAMRQAIDEHLHDQPQSARSAISAHLQRAFVEERRKFYQSARAAEARLQQSKAPEVAPAAPVPLADVAPAPLADIESVTTIRVPTAPPALQPESSEQQDEPTDPSVSPPLNTTFAHPSWRPTLAHPSRRIPLLVLCFGAVALLAAGWGLAKVQSRHQVVTIAAPTVTSVAPTLTPAAPMVPPDVPAIASSAVAPAISAAPRARPAVPRFPAGGSGPVRNIQPKPAANPSDQFGI